MASGPTTPRWAGTSTSCSSSSVCSPTPTCVATHHRLLGAQLVGPRGTETAKRVDTYATALFHAMIVAGVTELDLSYTPPLGSPWDAVQMATQAWVREHRLEAERAALSDADVP